MSSISHTAPLSRRWTSKLERAEDKRTPLAFFRRRRAIRHSLPEHVFCDSQYGRHNIV
jgi:hypothetical protein